MRWNSTSRAPACASRVPTRSTSPSLGVTKRQLADYVITVSAGMLAALRGRPTTMERWPGGVSPGATMSTRHDSRGEAFYQKKAPGNLPSFVETAEVTYPSGRRAHQVTPTNTATLVWMLNLGTLRWHPWPVTAPDTERVDELRIDLDPQPGTNFTDAARAAGELRRVLADAGLTGRPKTSGGRGLHVFCRIEPVDFVDARHATIAIGRELARRMPDRVTVNWWKEERGQRVFVDFNQMARDRLMASAYSIRPMPKAQVSAPLSWDEVADADPADFTVLTMPDRYAEAGDRWAGATARPPSRSASRWTGTSGTPNNGEGEMPYPPEYPKMPGEPPRVQPSRRRSDADD